MDKKLEFLDRVMSLCQQYGLCIVSGDPYEGIDVVAYDNDNECMYEGLFEYLTSLKNNNG